MDAGPRVSSYTWSGGREPMLCFGPEDGPALALALPLFEEANRTRAFGVAILRALAARGIGGVLPELPGQGESEIATDHLRLADLRAAFAAVPGSHAIAIRSGALVLDNRPCWLLAPQAGPDLRRELMRIKGSPLTEGANCIAGNLLSAELLNDLAALHPREGRDPASAGSQLSPRSQGGSRTVRLASDAQDADRRFEGRPLWRRAEPSNDLMLVQQLADDISDWVAPCAA